MTIKKLFAIVLSLVMIFAFTGCKTTQNNDQENSSTSTKSNDETTSTNSNDDTVQSEVEGTKLEDGNILYFEDAPSANALIEFKDENGSVLLTTSDILKVSAKFYSDGSNYGIELLFTPDGTEKFKNATQENLGKTISIFINNVLLTAPVVNDVITDGRAIISGGINSKENLFYLYKDLTNPTVSSSDTLPLEENTMIFYFSSGAGAWRTELTLNVDGTFTGEYSDSEMGSMGYDYPRGSVYLCNFSGKFSNFKKINDFSYQMTLTEITIEETPDEWIENGIRYIKSSPYGIDDGTTFILYLPNTPVSSLSEEFISWFPYRGEFTDKPDALLSKYGILNVKYSYGFFN